MASFLSVLTSIGQYFSCSAENVKIDIDSIVQRCVDENQYKFLNNTMQGYIKALNESQGYDELKSFYIDRLVADEPHFLSDQNSILAQYTFIGQYCTTKIQVARKLAEVNPSRFGKNPYNDAKSCYDAAKRLIKDGPKTVKPQRHVLTLQLSAGVTDINSYSTFLFASIPICLFSLAE